MALLSLQNVGMGFSERTLFDSISFEVGERDKIGFIGANGVGKTTLFKIICGELEPTKGSVTKPENLAEDIKKRGISVNYIDDFNDIADFLKKNVKEGDIVFTMGAGDVVKINDLIIE